MERALHHPRLLARLRRRQQQPVDAAALHDHGHVVRAGGVDPAVGAHPRRLHRGHGVAVPAPGRRPPGGLGHARDPGRGGVLLRADGRARPTRSAPWPGRSRPTGSAPTCCCRTTRWWRSTRRSSTSGSSASRSPSPSPSRRSSPGRIGEGWQLATRRWTLFAWAFLTVGIVLGRVVVVPGARVGRVLGAGTRSRTPRSCRGCAPPPTSTRSWSKSDAVCCGCGTCRSSSPRSA